MHLIANFSWPFLHLIANFSWHDIPTSACVMGLYVPVQRQNCNVISHYILPQRRKITANGKI